MSEQQHLPSTVTVDELRPDEADSSRSFSLQANEERLYCLVGLFGSARRKLDITLGAQAKLIIIGIFIGQGSDDIHLDITTHHPEAGSYLRVNIRGALADAAQANVVGKLDIPATGRRTDAFLHERIVTLSPQARSILLPSLEIQSDDVRAGHAATTGGLDERALFYLMSRGLPRSAAVGMLLEGFLCGAVAALPVAGRTKVIKAIRARLTLLHHTYHA